ncbi:MAG: DNA repair exonuclease [Planctomycetota bacterium]|nr:DNA repair exonuclease [Planctomycetota bacterium]MDP6838514.1 DNA repair exonuclease [Planctomycetota bacterium]
MVDALARLLAVGDMHLGLSPSGVPDLPSIDHDLLTPAAALANAVDLAIAEKVDGVLFAGDLVDSANARFEALRPLEDAIKRLRENGIRALAVVGNHDAQALPSLARTIEGLELVGEGGTWGSSVIEVAGEPAIEIIGWSFPTTHYSASPLVELLDAPLPKRGLPRIGLLHGDLDGSGKYAPFRRSELEAAALDGWLLGHIHRPSLATGKHNGEAPCGYLGSLVGLDGGESGDRGPWLVTVERGGGITCDQRVTAALRWEEISLQVAADTTPEDLGDLLMDETQRAAVALHERDLQPKALGLRITLVGTVHDDAALREWIANQNKWKNINRTVGETEVFIHKVSARLDLALDLQQLAKEGSPAGLLAQYILDLEREAEPRAALLAAARARLTPEVQQARWEAVRKERGFRDPLTDEALAERLRRTGMMALSALLGERQLVAGAGDLDVQEPNSAQEPDSRSAAEVTG